MPWALACVLLLAGCSRAPETRPSGDPYAAAAQALRAGQLQRAQEIVDAGGNVADPVAFRLLESEILLGRGQARPAFEILAFMPEPADPASRLRWMGDRAEALFKTRRPVEALALLDQVDRDAAGASTETALRARLLRSAILSAMERPAEADDVLRDVAERADQAGDSFHRAAAMLNFSFNRIRAGRYDDSLPYSSDAVKAANAAGALRIAGLANDNLGIAYTVLGDLTRAEQHIETSIRQLREAADLRNLADALGELGNVYLRKGEPARAQPYFEEAIQAAVKVEFPELAALWSGQLALTFIEQKKWSEAAAANQRALEFRGGDTLHLMINDAAIASGQGRTGDAIGLYRGVLAQQPKEAHLVWMGHIGLASLLAASGDWEQANREYLAGLEVVEQVRSSLHEKDYRIRYHDLKMQFFQEYVDLLVQRGDHERALQVAEFSRVRVLMDNLRDRPESIGDVPVAALRQYAARTGSVLLSYWLTPKRSFVWAITGRAIELRELPPGPAIDSLVSVYRRVIEHNMPDPIAAGMPQAEQLSKMLLDPVRDQLAGAKRVAIVADGPLHALNFETLPVDGKYWIEQVEVSVAPSLTLLAQPQPKRAGKPSLLLVGAPVPTDPAFPALPAADAEVAGIRARFAGREQVVRTGADATPEAFVNAMPGGFSMIHFAAHAEANPQSPFESAVILSRDRDRYKLYARDVADMKLTADLVTISACRSAGAGSYGGEGMVGFVWAFLHAGARSVIAGLWDVGDDSSAQLMTRLYEGLARGQTPAAALRAAKLAMLRSGGAYRNPYYWAPYQTYTR